MEFIAVTAGSLLGIAGRSIKEMSIILLRMDVGWHGLVSGGIAAELSREVRSEEVIQIRAG
ncbi:MAG: hypothetical protein LR011_08430 [Verrucomicrobia bacterium]|nr:hypothetical protein [Verrucomicrobiota bacterium]